MDTLVVTKRSQLTDIADAIRAKTGKSDEITLNDMPNEINGISGGGVINLGTIPEVNNIDSPNSNAAPIVKYNGNLYILVEE